jgi:hypothetical protein
VAYQVAYEPLTQLVKNENPYGNIVDSAMIETAVDAVRAQLETLRARHKALEEKKVAVEAENKRKLLEGLAFVDGPAAKHSDADRVAVPAEPAYRDVLAGLFWHFRGEPYRISKALRIEYPIGNGRTYSILIGFEGAGGGM